MGYDLIFFIGLSGGIVLVLGSAWPDSACRNPIKSLRNWLLAVGCFFMFTYSFLNYFGGGEIFFVFLQGLVLFATVLMFLNVPDKWSSVLVGGVGGGFVFWAMSLFEGYVTLLIVFGIIGVGVGYVLKPRTVRRNLALFVGSVFVAVFSWLVVDWIFFWLNVFFALFSGYYAVKFSLAKLSRN